MQRSIDRILTTHVGSLPRPDDLREMLLATESDNPPSANVLQARARTAVAEAVRLQVDAGIDMVNDASKARWRTTRTSRNGSPDSH